MATWQIVVGTVGLVMCAIAVFGWALVASAKLLEDGPDAQATVVRGSWAPGPLANDGGWGDAGHLRAMRAAQHRDELKRRLHATAKVRGRARLTGGDVPAA